MCIAVVVDVGGSGGGGCEISQSYARSLTSEILPVTLPFQC